MLFRSKILHEDDKWKIKCISWGFVLESNIFLFKNKEEKNKSFILEAPLFLNLQKIEKELTNENLDVNDIRYIILTHSHFDHAGGARKLKSMCPNSKIVIHKDESDNLCNGLTIIPKGSWITFIFYNILQCFLYIVRYDGIKADILIETFKKLNDDFYIVHTPGHSEGSISLFYEKEQIAFVGDLMNNRFISKWFGMHIAGFNNNLREVYESWRFLIKDHSIKKFYPSHGTCLSSQKCLKVLLNKQNTF